MLACDWSSCYTWCYHYSRLKNVSASSVTGTPLTSKRQQQRWHSHHTLCALVFIEWIGVASTKLLNETSTKKKIICETRLIATLFVFSSCLLCHSIRFCANANCTLSLNWALENNETISRDYNFQLSLRDWFCCRTLHVIHGWGTGYNVSIEIFFFLLFRAFSPNKNLKKAASRKM